MGTINIYNQIDDTHQIINGKGKLKDLLPNFNLKNAIILNAGNKLDENYFVQQEDIIYVRKIPGAEVATFLIVTAFITYATTVVGVGISGYCQQKNQQQMEKSQENAKKLAEQINQQPFIKGAKNKNAIGQSVPFVMGSVYHTPYKITDGFYSVGGTYGEKQYFNCILNLGFGKLKMTDFYCGEEKILSLSSNQSKKTYSFNQSSLFYDAENKIETVFPGDEFSNSFFTQKVISTQDGSEIKHDFEKAAEELIRTLSDYTQRVEVCIQFNGLREYVYDDKGDGNWTERVAEVHPYWSNDDGKTWNEFYFSGMDSNRISLNANKTIRFVATKTFSAYEAYGKTIKIKLVKTTPKKESNTNESCYLLYYNCFCYDNEKSTNQTLVPCKTVEDDLKNKTTRIGIRMIANDNSNGTLEEFHVMCNSLAKTWNNSTKTWSSTKSATRNPASIILEILTSEYHKASKFRESEIDLISLGKLYKYCEDNHFYTDGILTSEQKKRDLLSTILESVGATVFINANGLLEFVIDKKENTPVALLNAENLTNITYTKDLSRKVDGIKVTYTDRNSWQTNTFYAMLDGYPEAETLLTWKIRAKAVNIYGKKSENYTENTLDVSEYGTWQVGKPEITSRVNGRSVTLFFEQPKRTDGKTIYGAIRYKVQVKKTSETDFFKPTTTEDPYAAENNYKDGNGSLSSGDSFQQVLPLSGQDKGTPVDTPYTYKVSAYNESSESEATTINVITLATGVKDIVDAAITTNKVAKDAIVGDKIAGETITAEKIVSKSLTSLQIKASGIEGESIAAGAISADKINVDDLAAISGTFGKITDGGSKISSDANNFWDLKTGEFRVGNDINLEDTESGLPKEDTNGAFYMHFKQGFGLAIALAKFIVTATASVIKGVFKIQTNSGSDFVIANPEANTNEDVNAKTVKIKGSLEVDSGGSFGGNCSFGGANTFTGGNTFNAGNTFNGANTFNATNNFTKSNTFGAGNTFNGANTHNGRDTFNAGLTSNGTIRTKELILPTTASSTVGGIWLE